MADLETWAERLDAVAFVVAMLAVLATIGFLASTPFWAF